MTGLKRKKRAFTLVELLVALGVTSIILAAVATLAFAMSSASDTTDDTSRKQAQLRYTTMRISDCLRHCRLICRASDTDLAVWLTDGNNNGQINGQELVYIETDASKNCLRLVEYSTSVASLQQFALQLSAVRDGTAKSWLNAQFTRSETLIIPQCSNVRFDPDVSPPQTRFVSISFELPRNNLNCKYQITACPMASAANLLNAAGTALGGDDD